MYNGKISTYLYGGALGLSTMGGNAKVKNPYDFGLRIWEMNDLRERNSFIIMIDIYNYISSAENNNNLDND